MRKQKGSDVKYKSKEYKVQFKLTIYCQAVVGACNLILVYST